MRFLGMRFTPAMISNYRTQTPVAPGDIAHNCISEIVLATTSDGFDTDPSPRKFDPAHELHGVKLAIVRTLLARRR
jgi:hypothetical protein